MLLSALYEVPVGMADQVRQQGNMATRQPAQHPPGHDLFPYHMHLSDIFAEMLFLRILEI